MKKQRKNKNIFQISVRTNPKHRALGINRFTCCQYIYWIVNEMIIFISAKKICEHNFWFWFLMIAPRCIIRSLSNFLHAHHWIDVIRVPLPSPSSLFSNFFFDHVQHCKTICYLNCFWCLLPDFKSEFWISSTKTFLYPWDKVDSLKKTTNKVSIFFLSMPNVRKNTVLCVLKWEKFKFQNPFFILFSWIVGFRYWFLNDFQAVKIDSIFLVSALLSSEETKTKYNSIVDKLLVG